ncbi:MAG: hypothetical protein JWN34_463 [Bryobacterales bacterium]|nr:hypothetical protein [Bryobacterales bacterium]
MRPILIWLDSDVTVVFRAGCRTKSPICSSSLISADKNAAAAEVRCPVMVSLTIFGWCDADREGGF